MVRSLMDLVWDRLMDHKFDLASTLKLYEEGS